MLLVAAASIAATPETVETRERPETDPLGMRLGAFTLDSSVGLGYIRDDNIFAVDTGEVDDNILMITPEVLVASGWSRHSLRVGATAELGSYGDFDSEDYEDYRVFTDGRLDLARGNVTAGLSHSALHEPRTSPDDVGGLEPTTFDVTRANLAWLFQPGAFFLRPDVDIETFSFDDTPSSAGSIDNGDRDRDEQNFGLRAGYQLATDYDVFVEARASNVDYDMAVDSDGFERSSDGYEVQTGSTFDLGGSVFGEIHAGYRSWSYDDPRFEDIDGLAFGLDLTWNVTPLTTLAASGASSIESTTIENAAGIQRTEFGIGIDHELLRNLILWGELSVANEDFRGIDRDDDLFDAAVGVKYLMNRHLYLRLQVGTEQRDSSGSNSDGQAYDIGRIQFGVQWNL